eukprot:s692_g20.t1
MLTAIRTGMFYPDRSRSGMITPAGLQTPAAATPFCKGMPPVPQTPVAALPAPEVVVPTSSEHPSVDSWQKVQDSFDLEEIFSPADQGVPDSDTTEEDSVQSSSSSGEEEDEEKHRNFSCDPPSDFYINSKSLVVHCCRTAGVLKCGRRVTPNFSKAYELSGIRPDFEEAKFDAWVTQALVDERCHQSDTKVLRYIEPAKCNSRESEVAVGRTDRKLRIESNTLSVKKAKSTPDEDVSTSYKLQLCMRRRAVAYEFASLISFRTHEKYIDKLFRRLNAEPPPNYQATSLAQILRADREVWVHVSQNVDDIKQQADGSRPPDAALMDALNDHNVTFYLLPLPLPSSSSYAPVRNRDSMPTENTYKGKNQNRKGKGKFKGQQQGSSVIGPQVCNAS